NFLERKESEFIDGYQEQDTWKKAEQFIRDKFDIDADYRKIPLDVANMMNRELVRARNMFGTCGLVEKIIPDDGRLKPGDFASYNPVTKTITLRTDRGVVSTNEVIKKICGHGWFSTNHEAHIYTHEISHAIFNYFENIWTNHAHLPYSILSERSKNAMNTLWRLHHDYFLSSDGEGIRELSKYAESDPREMIAEGLTQIVLGEPSILAQKIWNIIKEA
ncbi:MAG: hypothetical protein IKS14_08170, partial [Thermoguttaceae bacterium]|nr:hypothetical protein [Thermoguttaceae bacterium]